MTYAKNTAVPIGRWGCATQKLPTLNLRELDNLAVAQALDQTGNDRLAACDLLGISLSTLKRRLRRSGGWRKPANTSPLPTCNLEALRYLALVACRGDSDREAARKLCCAHFTAANLRKRLHPEGEPPYAVRQALEARAGSCEVEDR